MSDAKPWNPLFLEALQANDWRRSAAYDIMAALRRPDDENEDLKDRFTAHIRAWVFGDDALRGMGLIVANRRPVFGDILILQEQASRLIGDHFISHIRAALQAMQKLEDAAEQAMESASATRGTKAKVMRKSRNPARKRK